jgi:hypothetical protein
MVRAEALALLAVPDGTEAGEIRSAYLRRAVGVRLEEDPATFAGLREAYEILTHGAGAPPVELASARTALSNRPDDVEARWRLLAALPYGAGPEASAVLREGAERQPEAFLDELLLRFPDRVSAEVARRARDGAGVCRLLLLADAHATEGRPAEALEALRAALARANAIASPAVLKLALRPIFSLQIHVQIRPAQEALALVQARMTSSALDGSGSDLQAATMFRVAVELAARDETFPLDLREVAARAAKQGDFQNAPYEAKYATRLLKADDVRRLKLLLKRDAPALAQILSLDLSEDQLRPQGTPRLRIPVPWGVLIVITLLYASWFIHKMRERPAINIEKDGREIIESMARQMYQRDCADPNSEACHGWDDEKTRLARYHGLQGDGGLRTPIHDDR